MPAVILRDASVGAFRCDMSYRPLENAINMEKLT